MANATPIHEIHQGQDAKNALEDVLREGARQLLQTAIEEEVAAYVAAQLVRRDRNLSSVGSMRALSSRTRSPLSWRVW